jgi:multidrug efflux pump subunit AcrA (membrane-fusion protein)
MIANPSRLWRFALVVCLASIAASGCGPGDEDAVVMPRPVTVIELHQTDPSSRLRLTGSVESWKEEGVGFEVAGRVIEVVEDGTEMWPPAFASDLKGDEASVIARLDTTRYELRVAALEKQLAAELAKADTVRTEMNEVLKEELAAAEARRDLAKIEYERTKKLFDQRVKTAQDLDRDSARLRVRTAEVAQVAAGKKAKAAELASALAQADQTRENVKEAKADLADCTLDAPFRGRVSKVHVIPGAYVQPGTPVATLVAMDPIKVDVAVSPRLERSVKRLDKVRIFPPGARTPLLGYVHAKETVADPGTRVFKITLLLRNQQVLPDLPDDKTLRTLPRVSKIWPLLEMPGSDSLFVPTFAIHSKDGKHFVWKAEATPGAGSSSVLTVKRVYVELGKRHDVVLAVFKLDEVLKNADLRANDLALGAKPRKVIEHDGEFVAGKEVAELKDGDKVFFAREQWLLRPGDVVRVDLDTAGPGKGFYVPMKAIIPTDDKSGFVCIVKDGKVAKIPVRIAGRVGESFQIKPATVDALKDGTQLISRNIHFLVPGDPVRVVKTEENAQ